MAEHILIPLGGMVLSGWIIYTVVAGIQNWYQRRTQAIFQSKMLDKIGSVNELGTFLDTDAGIRPQRSDQRIRNSADPNIARCTVRGRACIARAWALHLRLVLASGTS